jgi:hypothetical protein
METLTRTGFDDAVTRAVERLVSVRHEASGSFVTTSNMYPSGGAVVVWIRREAPHFFVSDFGFAYKECSIMGADKRQFMSRANSVAEAAGVRITPDCAFEAMVTEGQLEGAIKAIAGCSQEVAIKFAHRIFQRQRADIGTLVHDKLSRLYGEKAVAKDFDFLGASQSHWRIDVVVQQDDRLSLFDTVTPWAQSVAFTLAKFGDIRLLDSAPPRTAVLASRAGYGNWMTALAQNGSIIQAAANDDAYRTAARLL